MTTQSLAHPSPAHPSTPDSNTPDSNTAAGAPVEHCPAWGRRPLVGPTIAAQRLRLQPDALVKLVNAGTLTAYRFGDSVRFRPEDVDRVADHLTRCVSADSDAMCLAR